MRRRRLALTAAFTAVWLVAPHSGGVAWAAFSATASVTPRRVAEGADRSVLFGFTIRNTSSSNGERIGSISISAPSGWSVQQCPGAPAGWTARVDSGQRCLFESGKGSKDDIQSGASSSAFGVRALVPKGPDSGTWRVHVQHHDRFDPDATGSANDAQEAQPSGSGALTVTLEGTAPSPSPTKTASPTPTPTASPSASPSATPSSTPSATPSSTPTTSPSPSPSPTTPSPSPPASPSPTPTPQVERPSAPDLDASTDLGISPLDNETNHALPLFNGSAPEATSVDVFVDSVLAGNVPIAAGHYAFALDDLVEGDHSVHVIAKRAGYRDSTPSDALLFTIDRSAPLLTIEQPTNESTLRDDTPTLGGKAGRAEGDIPIVQLVLHKGTSTSGDPYLTTSVTRLGDEWTIELAELLADGTYTFFARQHDVAGNVLRTSSVTFTVDVPKPTPSDTPSPAGTPSPSDTPTPPSSGGGGGGGGGGGSPPSQEPAPGPSPAPAPRPSDAPSDECTTCGTSADDTMQIDDRVLRDGSELIETGTGSDEISVSVTDPGDRPWQMEIDAGDGADTIVIDIVGSAASQGHLLISGGGGNDMIVVNSQMGVEIVGGDGDDVIGCGSGSDAVSGGIGNDTVDCRGGDDQVVGGDDDDVVVGHGGSDTVLGGDGDDLLEGEVSETGRIAARSLEIFGSSSFLDETPGEDTISGGAGNDVLNGGDLSDTVSGGPGEDVVSGMSGNDIVFGNGSDDVIGGGTGDDAMRGNRGNDSLTGAAGRDVIWAGIGNDVALGGSGPDVLRAGSGTDVMKGGPGRDRCVTDRNDVRRRCEKT